MFAEDEARLLSAAASGSALDDLVVRRIAGEPLEHLLGWVEFAGLRLAVGPGVFVPRQRTQLMAAAATAAAGAHSLVVELCCGVAPIASLVCAARPGARVLAADLDPVAAGFARRNLDGRGEVFVGDLFDAVPTSVRGRIDVLAVNTPYVPSAAIAAMPPEARDHEPRIALDGGPDGLDVQRRVALEAREWLAPAGRVLVEVSEGQSSTSAKLFDAAGLTSRVIRDKDLDATVVSAGGGH